MYNAFTNSSEQILRPLIPQNAIGEVLLNWDYRYNRDSLGAALFEEFYETLLCQIIETIFKSAGVWKFFQDNVILPNYYHYFDDIIFEYVPNTKDY